MCAVARSKGSGVKRMKSRRLRCAEGHAVARVLPSGTLVVLVVYMFWLTLGSCTAIFLCWALAVSRGRVHARRLSSRSSPLVLAIVALSGHPCLRHLASRVAPPAALQWHVELEEWRWFCSPWQASARRKKASMRTSSRKESSQPTSLPFGLCRPKAWY